MLLQPNASSDFGHPIAPIKVLVVDDQPTVREGLARLIESAPLALRLVTTAATASEALSAAVRHNPDVVLLDVDLAGEDGLALIPTLALTAAVLVLTSHGDSVTRARAMQLGAQAFIEKHQPSADLLYAIADICRQPPGSRGEKAPSRPGSSAPLSMAPSSDAKTPHRP